eukprot:TRINITY_DN2555_c0_g1_i1.p1 TRINITY_DN2555_c0_g1~~TRINITY_DN2555_c0_g1_i1.p1  ORF type:complete len:687 (-),score=137.29 TRINITY_DN2555_c0_g1_i1:23-2083(-)
MSLLLLSNFLDRWKSLAPRRKNLFLGFVLGGSLCALYLNKKKNRSSSSSQEIKIGAPSKENLVNVVFFKRLIMILKIVVGPKEALLVTILTLLLLGRTVLSVKIADVVGKNAQFLVARKWKQMFLELFTFALYSIPAAIVNSGLKYFQTILALHIQVKLSYHVHNEYIQDKNFYKACNLGGKNRIDNADQRVTADIQKFSEAVSNLYSSLFKPTIDVILFTYKFAQATGWQGPTIMYSYFLISGIIKRAIMPSFGRLVARQSQLEGIYRTAHQQLIVNSEEIAFYDGSRREKTIINRSLKNLEAHIARSQYLRMLVGVFDGLLVKYWASIVGYVALGSPVFLGLANSNVKSTHELTRDFISNTQYLSNLATAVGQLVMVGNKLTTIAGYTSRVSELMEQVKLLSVSGTEAFELRNEEDVRVVESAVPVVDKIALDQWLQDWKARCDQRRSAVRLSEYKKKPNNGGGRFILGDNIKFENVDIVSPEGKLLVRDLNISVEPLQHVMVTGPNGAGKSSLFRIIGELWPLHNGIVTKPPKEDVLFVPQKPYLVLGTLRDQVIYPHSAQEMAENGVTDDDLKQLISIVDPSGSVLSNWKFDDEKDWNHALSGGQKQRIAMARLFYHRPLYAILDECTSAVSDEVEDKIYVTSADLGITLFTVSHRPYLRRYHNFILHFEGRNGEWSWTPVE